MKINNIDNIIYNIIIEFNNYKTTNKVLQKIYNENDFIKYLNEIKKKKKIFYKKKKNFFKNIYIKKKKKKKKYKKKKKKKKKKK